jgi:two-component system sensor histidine kinase GlrK
MRLILIGFSLVALPLIAALVIATISVDRLVGQSQRALLHSVLITQGSQLLVEAVTAMERSALQYQVLGDKVLFDVYTENHDKFLETARALDALDIADGQRRLIEELIVSEDEIHVILGLYPHDAPEMETGLARFPEIAGIAQQILSDSQRLIGRGIEQIQAAAEQAQRTLVLEAVALVPAAFVLSMLFAVLITRPIKQVDRAIRRLGDGRFGEIPVIRGPRDLEQLGERLSWLRDRLLELELEKTKFLQHVSHELKTPLTAIRESAELMNDQIAGDLNSQQREIVEILRDNSIQLQKLIEDLLNFSVLRSRASAMSYSRVAMKDLIEDVIEGHKVELMSRNVQLHKVLGEVSMVGDREKLRILMDNLVSNAIKYSPDGGPLGIKLFKRDHELVIEVTDSGPGIPAAEHDRVFEAFYQGAPADKGHVSGTGLGLSIAKENAHAHGGDITVLELNQTGTCLQVVLPMEKSTRS